MPLQKKLVLSLLCLSLALSSCQVESSEDDTLEIETLNENNQVLEEELSLLEEEMIELEETITTLEDELADAEEKVIVKEPETQVNPVIQITSPEYRTLYDPATPTISFTGNVGEGAEKIVVTAAFIEHSMDDNPFTQPGLDVYELTDFQSGDTSFTYRANSKWNNLSLGLNKYSFMAVFADGSTASTEHQICYAMEKTGTHCSDYYDL